MVTIIMFRDIDLGLYCLIIVLYRPDNMCRLTILHSDFIGVCLLSVLHISSLLNMPRRAPNIYRLTHAVAINIFRDIDFC